MNGDDYFQPPPKSPIPAAVVASLVTTLVLFFSLRALDERGAFTPAAKRNVAAPSAAVDVPALLGMRPEQAREILKGRDLLLAFSAERDSAKYAAGTVAEQSPLPGSQLPRGGVVQAALSVGVRQVPVPKVAGLKVEDAVRQLQAAGLMPGAPKAATSDTAPAGSVIDTEPPAGTVLAPQAGMGLVVSSGAAAKPIPKVTGLRLRAARDLLEQQGWKVGRIRTDSDGDRSSGIILEQRPAALTPAAAGATVDLTVNED
ncbi:MAG: PASTA domain-containing protein [Bacteroidota bacterium]